MQTATEPVPYRNDSISPYGTALLEEQAPRDTVALSEGHPASVRELLPAVGTRPTPFELNEPYELVFRNSGMAIEYRRIGDESNLLVGYLHAEGPNHEIVVFPLAWPDKATGATVWAKASFGHARTFRFQDMCKGRHAVFKLQGNHPVLELVGSPGMTEYIIPLDQVR